VLGFNLAITLFPVPSVFTLTYLLRMLSKQIEQFLCVYERRSLSTAALALGLTQPALTKSLRLLEQSLDVVLYDRRAGGMVPTKHGETLAAYARSAQNAWRVTLAELQQDGKDMQGELRIGAGAVWSLKVMPQALMAFRSEYPQVKITLETDVAQELLPKLKSGELDLFFGSTLGCAENDDIEIVPIKSSKVGAFVRIGHPLVMNSDFALAELTKFPWAANTRDNAGPDAISAYFRSRAIEPRGIDLQYSSLPALLVSLEFSDGIGFISADFNPEASKWGLQLLPLKEDIWSFPTGIAYRRSLGVLRHLQRLIALVSDITMNLVADKD
jgi:DNA-binding transcriptional LysR family regulator